MRNAQSLIFHPIALMTGLIMLMVSSPANAQTFSQPLARTSTKKLAEKLQVGDIVFINIDNFLFRKVASDTGSWTNHVGIVIDTSGKEPIVAESRVPLSSTTTLSKFIRRSKGARVEIRRLNTPLSDEQKNAIKTAAQKRLGIFYDAGFNLHSRRQFCSRYVYEVVNEATGITLGKIETLTSLFAANPKANLRFWKIWYFGNIPWQRETVTPASILQSAELHTVFDGVANDKVALNAL